MLKLHNVCKTYTIGKEEIPILENVNLTIHKGEFLTIVGPSGCGKTTLLNLIAGMDKMTKGTLEYEGKKMSTFRDSQRSIWRKNHIGYIFQNYNLIEFMTARQNIEMVLQLNGIGKQARKKKAEELLEMTGLKNRGGHRPAQLSGGQKQRVAIARAIANAPDILLADEPTGAVDSETAGEIMKLLHRINREKGTTVIMVTHDERLAEQADKKITMLDGRIVGNSLLQKRKEKVELQQEKRNQRFSFLSAMSVAFRNMFTKKKRTILTSMGTAIGIMGVLLVFGIGTGAKGRILEELNVIVNMQVVDVMETDVKMDAVVKEQLLEEEGILNIYPNNRPEAVCQFENVVCAGLVQVIGPLEQPISYWENSLEFGTLPESDDSREAVITKTMAQKLAGEGKDIQALLGKEVTMVFLANVENRMAVQVKETIVITGIAGEAFMGITEMIYLPYQTAEEIVRASLKEQDYRTGKYCVTVSEEKEAKRIKDLLNQMGFQASIDMEAIGSIGTVLDMVTAIIMLVAGISLVVSGIMIALVTYIGVVERTKEIGILRAVGFSKGNILEIFMTEGGIIGLLSGILGVLLATLFGAAVNAIIGAVFPEMAFSLYRVGAAQILFCMAFSILLGLLCSFSPARKAAGMEPVKALGYVQ